MKKCVLYLLSFVLSFTGLSVLLSSDAYAASDYDNVFESTSELRTSDTYGDHTCVTQDISLTFASYITDSSKWTQSVGLSHSEVSAAWSDTLANGTGWSVSEFEHEGAGVNIGNYYWGDGDYGVQIIFTPDASNSVDFTTSTSKYAYMKSPNTTPVYRVVIGQYYNTSTSECTIGVVVANKQNSNSSVSTLISNSIIIGKEYVSGDVFIYRQLFVNSPVSYPEGYEGYVPPDTYSPDQIVKPDFTYQINNKDITAKDYNLTLPSISPDDGYTIKGYSVEWSLFSCTSWDDSTKTCVGLELIDHKIQLQNQEYKYSIATFGDYKLVAQYLVEQCYRYPTYPLTPDNCFYVDLETELENYQFTSTSVYLLMNGQTVSGDTRDSDCDVSGYCEPPSPYEDCSVYGLDVVGGFGCIMRNFGIYLKILLTSLFVPSQAFFMNYFLDLRQYMEIKLGFLLYPAVWTYEFFNAFFAGLEPTTNVCDWTFGSIFGDTNNLTLNFCWLENISVSAWLTVQFSIQAFTVFGLISGLYSQYRRAIAV